ncbi:hypothetical protein HOV45_gp069 [Rheinheimera phage Barba8S]|jgi:hypothetical protein|uniref:Uncharacterized protein n=1 Tax=Rheinheimera phage Barba8S TaxID=2849600 RepID=A0A4P8MZX8_9CAUD|nr:hypothetical protein HOV45_gp069 [Rheinheimera phage Barba8S]QCQ59700.1 hypothetical protein Barba8S_gp069 [Rheinheimera phage Barba8S]
MEKFNMIICFLLTHLLELQQLPPTQQEYYILSNTNSCKEYPTKTWEIVGKNGKRVIVTNGVVDSKGYLFNK